MDPNQANGPFPMLGTDESQDHHIPLKAAGLNQTPTSALVDSTPLAQGNASQENMQVPQISVMSVKIQKGQILKSKQES